jgi:hypothetical protein
LEEDTDYAAELGEELQLALEGSPWLMGTPPSPSMDSPLALSGEWLQQLATGGNIEKVPHWTLEEELPMDMAGTMMTNNPAIHLLTGRPTDTELNSQNLGVNQ